MRTPILRESRPSPFPRPGWSSTAIQAGLCLRIAPVRGTPNRRHPNFELRELRPPLLEGRRCCLPGRCAAVRVQGRQQMGVIFSRSLSPSPLPHHRRHPFIPRAPRKTAPNAPHPSSAERATQLGSPGETSPLRIRRWTVCGHPFSGKAGQAPPLDPVGPPRPSKQAPP